MESTYFISDSSLHYFSNSICAEPDQYQRSSNSREDLPGADFHDNLSTSVPSLDYSIEPRRQGSRDSVSSSRSDRSDTAQVWTRPSYASSLDPLHIGSESLLPHLVSTQMHAGYPDNYIASEHRQAMFPVNYSVPVGPKRDGRNTGAISRQSSSKYHGVRVRGHAGDPATCTCGKMYKGIFANTNLMRHIRSSCGKSHVCPYCFREFSRSDNMRTHCHREHIAKHRSSGVIQPLDVGFPFQCSICGMYFARKGDYERHLTERHPSN